MEDLIADFKKLVSLSTDMKKQLPPRQLQISPLTNCWLQRDSASSSTSALAVNIQNLTADDLVRAFRELLC